MVWCYSIVVDDVDARNTEDDSHVLHKLLTDTSLDLRKCSQYRDTKEESDARIKQIQVSTPPYSTIPYHTATYYISL